MNFDRSAPIFLIASLLVLAVLPPRCEDAPQLGDPLPGLTAEQRERFELGRQVFERVFTAETGLGPLFNADACAECHEDPITGGSGNESELHATMSLGDLQAYLSSQGGTDIAQRDGSQSEDTAPTAMGCDLLVDQGGPVYQLHVTDALRDSFGIDHEPVPSGANVAMRTTPDLFGFGLLDAVEDSVLLALADPDDRNGDGISGRVNRFVDGRIGRFGRKAFSPTLAEFNAMAFQLEQGVTTFAALDEGTVAGRPLPPGVDPLPEPELDEDNVRAASDFVAFLAPPTPLTQGRAARHGAKIFKQIQCAACHVPVLQTGPNDVEALSHREVHAYTDLLLHDMGPELADICMGQATASEFRTEPLMGLHLEQVFLHDGRAGSIDEAIQLHGGEAAAARDAFLGLPQRKRQDLLAFLRGL